MATNFVCSKVYTGKLIIVKSDIMMLVLKVAMSVLQEKLKIGTCAGTVQFAFETYLYRICEI